MKSLASLCLAALLLSTSSYAQTVRRSVTVDETGALVAPVDLWSVNAPAISTALSLGTAATADAGSTGLQVLAAESQAAARTALDVDQAGTNLPLSGGELTGNLTMSGNLTVSGDITLAQTDGVLQTAGPMETFGNFTAYGDTTLGSSSLDSVYMPAGVFSAPNATGTNASDIANVGTLETIMLTPGNTMPSRGETFFRDSSSGNGLKLIRGYIQSMPTGTKAFLVGDGKVPSRLFSGKTSVYAGPYYFEGWGGQSGGTIVIGSLGITLRSQQYSVTLASALTLSRGDVLTGNVTGAQGEVYFLDGSAGPTSTTGPAVRLTNGTLFTAADTDILVNGIPSGVGVTTTPYGTNPGVGLYIMPEPSDLSLITNFNLSIVNASGVTKNVIFEILLIN